LGNLPVSDLVQQYFLVKHWQHPSVFVRPQFDKQIWILSLQIVAVDR
jgi:hypothetical protein